MLGALRYLLAAFPALLFVKPPKVPLRLYLLYGMTMAVAQFALLFTAIHIGMPFGLGIAGAAIAVVLHAAAGRGAAARAVARQPGGRLGAGGVGLVLIGSAHGASMPLAGFALTVAAAAMWGCGNLVTRAVGRHGPMNQFAFIVWSSVVAPLPFVALSLLLDGPATVWAAVQHLSLKSMAAVAYIAWISACWVLGCGRTSCRATP